MKTKQLSPHGLGLASAIVSGLGMLVVSILGLSGKAMEVVKLMQAHHIWYDLTGVGIIAGIIEAFIFGYVIAYIFGWIYNRVA